MGKQPANKDIQFWRDPDLPGVEIRRSSYNRDAFRDHTHETYSIGLLDSGRTTFSLEGEEYQAEGGQIVVIGPHVVHACNPDLESGMTYRMFYVEKEWLVNVAREVLGQDAGIPAFPFPVVDDPDFRTIWLNLFTAVTEGASRLEKESLLVTGLAGLIASHGKPEDVSEAGEKSDAVGRAKEYIADNLSEKVSLDRLSKVAHLSRYHLLRVFQSEVGLPPHAYQNQLRVELGKSLLTRGLSISQAAVEAGFVDQSHFSRVFKQYTGATPKQYQVDANS